MYSFCINCSRNGFPGFSITAAGNLQESNAFSILIIQLYLNGIRGLCGRHVHRNLLGPLAKIDIFKFGPVAIPDVG